MEHDSLNPVPSALSILHYVIHETRALNGAKSFRGRF